MPIVIALIVIAVGSVAFHMLNPWWLTPIASNWKYIDTTIAITFWITGFVFTAVVLFMAYCVFRFRHKDGSQAAYRPENNKLEWGLAIVTGVGVVAMLTPGLFVWSQFVTAPPNSSEIEVVGEQWSWAFRLPGKNGRLGASDNKYVSPDNPLGINPDDPNGKDNVVIVGDDLHLPVGKPVRVWLRSVDVVHDFYVPEFRAKMDLMPGMVTRFWFTPTRTGTFEILCAGFCGVGHPQMRGNVVIDTENDYRTWLQKQQTFAQLSTPAK
jgi:cytochrome c oxidase subunit 2